MYGFTESEAKIMKDLVSELSKLNAYMKEGASSFGPGYMRGNYFYAFNPVANTHRETYKEIIQLMSSIHELLDDNCINIKSQGYTYIKDAICIIIDRKSRDVCMMKEVYPYIAEKYKIKNISKVEHSIRNALDAAYTKCKEDYPDKDCLLNFFDAKPTNKKFILRAVQQIGEMTFKDFSA